MPHRAASSATPEAEGQRRCWRAWRIGCVWPRRLFEALDCARANSGSLSAVARWVMSPTTSWLAPQFREPPPPHPGVELEVGPNALRDRQFPHGELETRPPAPAKSPGPLTGPSTGCAPRKTRRGAPAPLPLSRRRGRRTLGERRAGDVDGPMAVAVRLDDGPQRRALEHVEQPAGIPPHGAEIDRDLRPMHPARGEGRPAGRRPSGPTGVPTPRRRRCGPEPPLPRRGAAPFPWRGTRPRRR